MQLEVICGPAHWEYPAGVMADHLEAVGRRGWADRGIPPGALLGVLEFFGLVLPLAMGAEPENPVASGMAYMLADEIMRRDCGFASATRAEINGQLAQYEALVRLMRLPRDLTDEEKNLAGDLAGFLRALHERGLKMRDPGADLDEG